MRALLANLVDFLYPPRCCACDDAVADDAPFCTICAISVEPSDSSQARYGYGGSVAIAIQRMKFGDRPDLARPLGRALAAHVHRDRIDVLVPVPLHRVRLRTRRYNVPALLAREVGARVERPVDFVSLERVRDTPPQASLAALDRRRNVLDAFRVRRAPKVGARRVLLIDDVYTTGATAQECRRALLHAGAATVEILTLCRTMTR